MAAQDEDRGPGLAEQERLLAEFQQEWAARPGKPQAALGAVRALAALDRPHAILRWAEILAPTHPEIADRALRIATRKLRDNLPIGLAWCHAAASDPQEAGKRWWDLRKRFPRKTAAHVGYIDAMIGQRAFAEAERAASSALRFLGQRPDLLAVQARVAEARGDWAEAARGWDALGRLAPGEYDAEARLDRARRLAATTPPPEAPVPQVPPVSMLPPEEFAALRKRLMGFESLGRNCEFGLLQRKFEAEPLGLLRFSTTRPATLLTLLRTRFEGIGDPARNEVVLVKNEWRLRHRPSGWRMHTHIMADREPDAETVLHDQCRRTGFLRHKLIRDLESAAKIFVYQQADLSDADAAAIHEAIQAFGPNLLLCVRVAGAGRPPGAIDWPEPSLMLATIDRQGQEFTGAGWDISVDYWLHFCAAAERRRDELAWNRKMEQAFPA